MPDLTTFTNHVQHVLHDGFREHHWTAEQAERYMAEVGIRRQRFEELARHLNETIVRPRIDVVANLFQNSIVPEEQMPHGSCCWFEYCERFPADTSVDFSIDHDVDFDKVIVRTRTRIMPVFVRFNEQDSLLLPLASVDEAAVADWVEERLLEFLDTYLRIDADGDNEAQVSATDPVCGMPILRSEAVAVGSYCGHPYYFCSEDCLSRFLDEPTEYVQIKTM